MKLSDWGESGLVDYVTRHFQSSEAMLGIGDDCAVLSHTKSHVLLATTDALCEDVHFIREKISPTDLGYKSIMVNLSDIAGMGGNPKYCLVSLALPAFLEKEWITDLLSGMKAACDGSIDIVGGDTVRSEGKIFINVTALGTVEKGLVKYRHTAKSGDAVCVTGFLGDSFAGYLCLKNELPLDPDVRYLINQHHRPKAHLSKATWLSVKQGVNAMMDISDGLDQDLTRLIKASNCGAVVEVNKVPLSQPLKRLAKKNCWSEAEMAIRGGEDYVLLVTIDEGQYDKIAKEFLEEFDQPIYKVGRISQGLGKITYENMPHSSQLTFDSYQHFAAQ